MSGWWELCGVYRVVFITRQYCTVDETLCFMREEGGGGIICPELSNVLDDIWF